MCNANGPSTPGLLDSLAVSVNRSIAFQHAKTLGRIQQKPCFRSSIPFRAGRYSLTFHPHYLSVYASTGDFGDTPYTQAATLDTGPVASSYPGGSHTRSSSNYFQSALASHGSALIVHLKLSKNGHIGEDPIYQARQRPKSFAQFPRCPDVRARRIQHCKRFPIS